MIRTDIVKITHVDDTYYVLDDVPYTFSETLGRVASEIYVPSDKLNEYKNLNSTIVNKIKPYNYGEIRNTQPSFYKHIAVIMTNESNPEVLSVLYENNLCKGDEYMTLEEATKITGEQIGEIFRGNTYIKHFEEFQYFTSVTETNDYLFFNCHNLEIVTLPQSVIRMGKAQFGVGSADFNAGKRSKLKYVSGLGNVEEVGQSTFQYCHELISVDFSTHLKVTNGYLFNHCQKLESVGDLSGIELIKGDGLIFDCPTIKSVKLTTPNLNKFCLCGCNNLIPTLKWEEITILPAYALGMYANVNTSEGIAIEELPNMPNLTTFGTTGSQKYGVNFQGCKKLRYIGNCPKLTSIEMGTFNMCKKLQIIGNMDSVTAIKLYGFADCPMIEYAYFPICNSVGQQAFLISAGNKDYEVNRVIEFGLPYEQITFHKEAFKGSEHTKIICNKVELTEAQYTAVGATKPNF